MAEAAFSPGLDTVAPSRALELSGSVNAASSSLVLLDVLGVSACMITLRISIIYNMCSRCAEPKVRILALLSAFDSSSQKKADMTFETPTSSGYAVVHVHLPVDMAYYLPVQSSSLRANADLADPTLLASRSLLASIMSDASSASLMDWGWMEPGPPRPPAGTARAAGGGSSFEKSIRGRPGVEGTPAAKCQDVLKKKK